MTWELLIGLIGILLVHWVSVYDRNAKDERIMDLYLEGEINAENCAHIIGVDIREFLEVVDRYEAGELETVNKERS